MTDKEQVDRLIKATEAAEKQGHLSTTSVNNIRRWLTSDSYAEYFNDLAEHVGDQNWQQLEQ